MYPIYQVQISLYTGSEIQTHSLTYLVLLRDSLRTTRAFLGKRLENAAFHGVTIRTLTESSDTAGLLDILLSVGCSSLPLYHLLDSTSVMFLDAHGRRSRWGGPGSDRGGVLLIVFDFNWGLGLGSLVRWGNAYHLGRRSADSGLLRSWRSRYRCGLVSLHLTRCHHLLHEHPEQSSHVGGGQRPQGGVVGLRHDDMIWIGYLDSVRERL